MTNQLAHKDFFNTPTVKQKFQEVLNGNERQFTASLCDYCKSQKKLHEVLTLDDLLNRE